MLDKTVHDFMQQQQQSGKVRPISGGKGSRVLHCHVAASVEMFLGHASRCETKGLGMLSPSQAESSGPKIVAVHTKRFSSDEGLALQPCSQGQRFVGERARR